MSKSLRVVLNVSRFDTVVAFYRDLIGLPMVGGWDRGIADQGALLEVAPGGVVEIVGHGADFTTPSYADLAIAIEFEGPEKVDAMHQRLTLAGVLIRQPTYQSWGHYSSSVRDPVAVEVVLYAEVADT
jgi:catechol 2,3-dioxygenase-like lactoylglutathione lyase family enzyme